MTGRPLLGSARSLWYGASLFTVSACLLTFGCASDVVHSRPDEGAASGPRADPGRLPVAMRQAPQFQGYRGREMSSGESYTDPASGALVTKLTDASTPRTNTSGLHHYSSGPLQISREWGDGAHTIDVSLAGVGDYLVDYRRGGGLSNWRKAGVVSGDLTFTFSYDPATPRIAYYTDGMTVRRYDTATMSAASSGHFPKDFSAVGTGSLLWLQNDARDEWFVMMTGDQSRVIAWNSRTDQTLARSWSNIDEPHLDRDGRFVFVSRDSDWLVWDLQTNTTRGPFATPFRGHPGAYRTLFAASDGNDNPAVLWTHNPVTHANANIYVGEQVGNGGQHRGDGWVMTDEELDGNLGRQWLLQTVHDEGEASAGAWARHAGEIHVAPVDGWGSTYGKPAIGIRAVRQHDARDPTRYSASLAPVSSVGALVEGSFHYDAVSRRIYAWMFGGGSPAGRVEVRAPALVHDAIALVRLDGREVRLLAHHYSLDAEARYAAMPKATISPDGKLVVFSSNMNDSDGRVDVFAVEVPLQ